MSVKIFKKGIMNKYIDDKNLSDLVYHFDELKDKMKLVMQDLKALDDIRGVERDLDKEYTWWKHYINQVTFYDKRIKNMIENIIYLGQKVNYYHEDIIINPNDAEKYIGKDCYFGDNPNALLESANKGYEQAYKLKSIDDDSESYPFARDTDSYKVGFGCIIPVKELVGIGEVNNV